MKPVFMLIFLSFGVQAVEKFVGKGLEMIDRSGLSEAERARREAAALEDEALRRRVESTDIATPDYTHMTIEELLPARVQEIREVEAKFMQRKKDLRDGLTRFNDNSAREVTAGKVRIAEIEIALKDKALPLPRNDRKQLYAERAMLLNNIRVLHGLQDAIIEAQTEAYIAEADEARLITIQDMIDRAEEDKEGLGVAITGQMGYDLKKQMAASDRHHRETVEEQLWLQALFMQDIENAKNTAQTAGIAWKPIGLVTVGGIGILGIGGLGAYTLLGSSDTKSQKKKTLKK